MFDNWIFLLLIAVAALLRLLASKAGEAKKDLEDESEPSRPLPPPPVTRAPGPVNPEEERIRKFLEALGVPTTSPPPPPIAPRTNVPPRPLAPIKPPPGMIPFPRGSSQPVTPEERRKRREILHEKASEKAEDWLRKINAPGKVIEPSEPKKVFMPRAPEAPVFEVQEQAAEPAPPPLPQTPADAYAAATQPKVEPDQREIDLATLLRSSSGLRTAIILREVFGPPRSLQPLELVGQPL